MRYPILLLVTQFFVPIASGQNSLATVSNLNKGCTTSIPSAAPNYFLNSQSPLLLMENKGQVADIQGRPLSNVLFTAASGATNIWFNKTGISYQFTKASESNNEMPSHHPMHPVKGKISSASTGATQRVDMTLLGANAAARIIRGQENGYFENYYLGHCPQGITHVQAYERVMYQDIYPNIDWVIYSKAGAGFEYDFIVHPGGNPDDIKIAYSGADDLSIQSDGSLAVHTLLGDLEEAAPCVTQSGDHRVDSRWALNGTRLSFEIGSYNPTRDLVIDPTVAWSTYFGGAGHDDILNVCVTNKAGEVYLVGSTTSSGLGASGFQNTYGGGAGHDNAYVSKFSTSGARLWTTYYGDTTTMITTSAAIDPQGDVYIGGRILNNSPVIPFSAYQSTFGGSGPSGGDGFIAKFSSSGVRLMGTYYGGTSDEFITSLCTDRSGNLFAAGITNSSNAMASLGAHKTTYAGGDDVFLAKFSPSGARLWSTYFGGSGVEDRKPGCTTDTFGNVYLSGATQSMSGIASAGSFQSTYGGAPPNTDLGDAFLAKFSPSGTQLWATYYGGTGGERGYSCATDVAGNVYMTGFTTSTGSIATPGAYQISLAGRYNIYLVKFSSSGSRLWGTYLGGAQDEEAFHCMVHPSGSVYVIGIATSTSGIVKKAFQNSFGGNVDAFIAKFSQSGYLYWSSYFGGAIAGEYGYGGAMDTMGNVYLAGGSSKASSPNIISGGFQTTYGGGFQDALLVKINDCNGTAAPAVSRSGNTLSTNGYLYYNWYVNGMHSNFDTSRSIQITRNGSYSLEAIDSNGCMGKRTVVISGVGVGAFGQETGCYLSPNPFSKYTVLQFTNARKLPHQLLIYNTLGQLVFKQDNVMGDQVTIERGDMPGGVYYYRLNSSEKLIDAGKFIVQ